MANEPDPSGTRSDCGARSLHKMPSQRSFQNFDEDPARPADVLIARIWDARAREASRCPSADHSGTDVAVPRRRLDALAAINVPPGRGAPGAHVDLRQLALSHITLARTEAWSRFCRTINSVAEVVVKNLRAPRSGSSETQRHARRAPRSSPKTIGSCSPAPVWGCWEHRRWAARPGASSSERSTRTFRPTAAC